MITFPNAKINLGLNITEKRPDGYHNLETLFYPVHSLEDALEIDVPTASHRQEYTLRISGMEVAGPVEDNLVVKAYLLLRDEFRLPPVNIHLFKHIPSGAGLGGGSADAAFMLTLLNERFAIGLTDDQMERYATTLGADCAFFIRNKPTYAEGTGNIFSPIKLSLSGYKLLIVKHNDIFVSTREAFSFIKPHRPICPLREIIARPVAEWKELLVNDFEASVFRQHPLLEKIKEELYLEGALYASMSGSGSSIFALFAPEAAIPILPPSANLKDAWSYWGILK